MLNIGVAHTEKYPAFPHDYHPTYYNITITIIVGYKPGHCTKSIVCWHTALLEDVSITVMAQVDEASLAPAFSSMLS